MAGEILHHSTEQHLLKRLAEDDRDAFAELYHLFWEELYNSAFKRTDHPGQSEDIVQEVFTDLWGRRKLIKIEKIGAFLHTAIKYQVLKLAARKKVADAFLKPLRQMEAAMNHADFPIKEKELNLLFHKWLNTLPEKKREIFLLHFIEQLSTHEIAEKLGISQKTVQNQLGTAKISFKKEVIGGMLLLLAETTNTM